MSASIWALAYCEMALGAMALSCADEPRRDATSGTATAASAGMGSPAGGEGGSVHGGQGANGGAGASDEGDAAPTAPAADCGALQQVCCTSLVCNDDLRCRGGTCQHLAVSDFGRPCELDAQCVGGLCLADGAGAFHCSARCGVAEDCLPGWACAGKDEVTPQACRCEPTAEKCNGIDDDCNGIVDDEPVTKPACVEQVGAGAECQAGACNCTGLTCGEACVDPKNDRQNCGACGITCVVECSDGACLQPTAVRVSDSAACTLLDDGSVRCWGEGPIGDGTRLDRPNPVQLSITEVVDMDMSFAHACAAKKDGTLRCWGDNGYGKLGVGEARVGDQPVVVPGLNDVRQVALGYNHSCVLRDGGLVSCWGADLDGQVGIDREPASLGPTTPVEIPDLKDVTKLAVGHFHGCALLSDATVVCWGQNDYGQLGDDTTESRSKPLPVKGLSQVIDVAAGESHSCALLEGGKLMCWGGNDHGQLGSYDNEPRLVPTEVPFRLYDSIQASGNLSFARAGDTYYGWGRAIPDGDGGWQISTNTPSPMIEFGLANDGAAVVDASEGVACALSSSEHHCWGIPFGDDSFVLWP